MKVLKKPIKLIQSLVGKMGFTKLQRHTSGGKYLERGKGSEYPSLLIDCIENSDSLAKTLKVKQKFIKGRGFAGLNDEEVNTDGFNLYDLMGACAYSLSANESITAMITYNLLGEPQINPIPFDRWAWENEKLECIVLLNDAKELAKDEQGEVIKLPVYKNRLTTEKRVQDLNKQFIAKNIQKSGWLELREVYIDFHKKDNSYLYPIAPFHSVIRDCLTEISLKESKYRDATCGFAPKVMVTFYGNEASNPEQEEDENGNIVESSDDQSLESLNKQVLDMLGSSGGVAMVNKVQSRDAKPDIDPINLPNPDKMYEYTEKSVRDNITNNAQIPQILFGNPTAGKLGDSQEFENAIKYMQDFVVFEDQMLIYKFLNKFLPHRSNFKDKWSKDLKITQISWETAKPTTQNDTNAGL